MITVIVQNKSRTQSLFDLVVAGPKELFALLMIFESTEQVIAYKIVNGERLISDVYREFGWGTLPKFTSVFNWNKS